MPTETQLANRRAWIDALRNGTYKQGTGIMRSHEGFCCLGVLCDIAQVPSRKSKSSAVGRHCFMFPNNIAQSSVPPGPWIADHIGMSAGEANSLINECWHRNDRLHHSFEQIADFLEICFEQTV